MKCHVHFFFFLRRSFLCHYFCFVVCFVFCVLFIRIRVKVKGVRINPRPQCSKWCSECEYRVYILYLYEYTSLNTEKIQNYGSVLFVRVL